MKALFISAPLICCALLSTPSLALAQDATSQETASAKPVNTMCPIGKEPIVASAGTLEYEGHTIGVCCPGCADAFLAWDAERKNAFVALAVAHREPGMDVHASHDQAADVGAGAQGPTYPYTLADCPVGGPLGSMGDPIVKVYDNREVRFCCAGCIGTFEANKAKFWGEINMDIVAQQLMHYPIDTCIVTGQELGEDAVNHVHNNRLVRLANADAAARFAADPEKHLEALDEAIIEAQLPDYPMSKCPVGGPLGSMGEPVNFIYMNRLVRLCCDGCEKSIADEPAKYMGMLDKAYADAQRETYPLDTCVVAGGKLGSMGEPVEIVAGTQLVRFCCEGCLPKFEADPQMYLSKLPQE